MLDILSWNIRQGGGSRIPQIVHFIRQTNAQIVVLSEFRNNDRGIALRHHLLKLNYLFQIVSGAKGDLNAVLIASRLPCNGILYPKADLEYPHNVIEADFPAFRLLGMYLPHKKKHQLFPFIMEQVKQEKPVILVGDMNTGINHVDQKGSSFWYSEYFEKLNEVGYVDAFRHIHGDVETYSWYSHQGNGYRYDHTIVHESILPIIKSCDYLHEARVEKYSDHSPMVLRLG